MRGGIRNSLGVVIAISVLGAAAPAFAAGGLKLWPPDWAIVGVNVAVFAALIYPMQRLLLAPLVRILQEREARMGGASEEAESLQEEARRRKDELDTQAQNARLEAQSRRNAVMAEAAAEERALLEAARSEGSRNLDALRGSIAGELEEARRGLEADARMLAREAAAKILGRVL